MHCIDHPCILLVPNDEIASLSIPSLGTPSNDRLPSTVQPPTHLLLYMITTAAAADTKETRGAATTFRRKLLTMTHTCAKKNRPQKENHLHIEVCSCQSSRLQHICSARQKDALVVLKGGDSGPLEPPAAPGLMTVCRFGVVSEFGRRIDADHLLGTCARCSRQKSKPKPSLLLLRLPTTRILIHSFSSVWMLPTTQLKSY